MIQSGIGGTLLKFLFAFLSAVALFPGSSSTAANGPLLEPGAPGPVLSSDVVRVATAAGAKCFGRPDLIADQITIGSVRTGGRS